jgi:hypothetical protein
MGGAVLFAWLFRSADPKDRLTRKATVSVELGGGLTLIGHLRAISRSLREYLRKPERAAANYE